MITEQELRDFADKLLAAAVVRDPDVRIEISYTVTGHIAVHMHSRGETDLYLINPIDRTWIKTYGWV